MSDGEPKEQGLGRFFSRWNKGGKSGETKPSAPAESTQPQTREYQEKQVEWETHGDISIPKDSRSLDNPDHPTRLVSGFHDNDDVIEIDPSRKLGSFKPSDAQNPIVMRRSEPSPSGNTLESLAQLLNRPTEEITETLQNPKHTHGSAVEVYRRTPPNITQEKIAVGNYDFEGNNIQIFVNPESLGITAVKVELTEINNESYLMTLDPNQKDVRAIHQVEGDTLKPIIQIKGANPQV